MFGIKSLSHGDFVRSSPSLVYITMETLIEKILGLLCAGSLRLALTDVKKGEEELKQGSKICSPKYGLKTDIRVSEEYNSEREKKGNIFMVAYLRTFKNSCDSLASINTLVSQSDMFIFLLTGLPSEYESFVATVKLQRQKQPMAELRSSLLFYDSWLQQMHHITILIILSTNRVCTRSRTCATQVVVTERADAVYCDYKRLISFRDLGTSPVEGPR
ncbi:hypothetical protein FXO38_25437 [Capsicum annuum]|nr:hypothetical protein FXO38_25437 [Capsicum annuum]KAF3636237.1 hypothetical protein FXO37_25533 [Capsicum annuum]